MPKFIMRNDEVFAECLFCKKEVKLNLTSLGLNAINRRGDRNIQDVPEAHGLTPSERELFISGVCQTCYDDAFSGEEE